MRNVCGAFAILLSVVLIAFAVGFIEQLYARAAARWSLPVSRLDLVSAVVWTVIAWLCLGVALGNPAAESFIRAMLNPMGK